MSRLFHSFALCCTLFSTTYAAENPAIKSYRFTAINAPVGLEMTQDVSLEMELKTTIYQSIKIVGTKTSSNRRRQRRIVTVMKPEAGEKARAKVHYELARRTVRSLNKSADTVSQPVVGKTYLVARQGSQLTVTDTAGKTPPPEELTIVQENMQALGQVNPIARFLDGRRLSIGERVELPKKLAQDLLNMESVGDVSKLEMVLNEVRQIKGRACAVLEVRLLSRSSGSDGLAMQLSGKLLVEIETCRTLELSFTGPVGFVKSSGLSGTGAIASGRGKLNLAMQTSYRATSLR